MWRASEGVAALTEDFRVESKLIPRRKARSMLFRMRCAGLLETALDLSDWEAVFCDRARTNAGGTAAAVVGGLEGAEALVLIVESGLPPIGKSGSRLCFMRLGAENCLLSSSSSTCLISGCCDPPPFPSDSGPVEAGACVLPDKFSELWERRGDIGCSWNRPGSGAIIARPFDEDSAESEDEGRENW